MRTRADRVYRDSGEGGVVEGLDEPPLPLGVPEQEVLRPLHCLLNIMVLILDGS